MDLFSRFENDVMARSIVQALASEAVDAVVQGVAWREPGANCAMFATSSGLWVLREDYNGWRRPVYHTAFTPYTEIERCDLTIDERALAPLVDEVPKLNDFSRGLWLKVVGADVAFQFDAIHIGRDSTGSPELTNVLGLLRLCREHGVRTSTVTIAAGTQPA